MKSKVIVLNDNCFTRYLVTKNGNVYSKDENGFLHELHPSKSGNGQYNVTVYRNKISGESVKLTVSMQIIVANMFIEKTDTDIKLHRNIVHFKDWDPSHFYAKNLEWMNKTELYILNDIRKYKKVFKKCVDFRNHYYSIFSKAGYSIEQITAFFKKHKADICTSK